MTDFIPEPRDRLDQPICSAIEAKNFKQALKLVEKRLSKSSDSHLLALRCFIQASHSIIAERSKAAAQILGLANGPGRDTPRDVAELELYDEASKILFPDGASPEALAIGKIHVDAVKLNPKDEKLAKVCFRSCLRRDDIEHAQQIANSLDKHFPSNHDYPFWNITTTSLFASSQNTSKDRAKLYSELAYKQIQKLADATSGSAHGSKLLHRSIENPQELRLLHRLLSNTGREQERLDLMRSADLGISSKIAKGEWIFRREQIMLLDSLNKWEELFKICDDLLTSASARSNEQELHDTRGADWLVWKSYIKAAVKLREVEYTDAVKHQMEAHQATSAQLDKAYQRNAFLAMVEFSFVSAEVFPEQEALLRVTDPRYESISSISARIFHLHSYLSRYGHTPSAFSDVKGYIERLEFEGQARLLYMVGSLSQKSSALVVTHINQDEKIEQHLEPPNESEFDKMTSAITISKLQYLIFNSLAEIKRKHSPLGQNSDRTIQCSWCSTACGIQCHSCLQEQVSKALQSYSDAIKIKSINDKLLSTDKHPADDWSIISSMCLVKLAVRTPDRNLDRNYCEYDGVRHILQAVAILEFAHTKSKANPQILLLLARLYSKLGAGSLAMRAYSRLGVKQIQNDTLSYIIFDRISLFHPHVVAEAPNGMSDRFHPVVQLERLQRLYSGFGNSISSNCWRSFENRNYDSIFQLLEVSDRLSRSIGKAISVIEFRKIKRLVEPTDVCTMNNHGYDLLKKDPVLEDFSDNLDYLSFPNYEQSGDVAFEAYTRLGPASSDVRTRAQLFIDELWTLAKCPFENEASKTAAIQHFLRSRSKIIEKPIIEEQFTIAEYFALEVALTLGSMVSLATAAKGAQGQVASVEEDVKLLTTLLQKFEDMVNKIEIDDNDFVPSFNTTLEPLYGAYDSISLIMATTEFVSKYLGNKSPSLYSELLKAAGEARNAVALKAGKVRKYVSERSWLDFILDEVHAGLGPAEDDSKGAGFGDLISDTLSQEFLENWAGELVESWRDSVSGLAYLKTR